MHFRTGILTRCTGVLLYEFHYCSNLNMNQFLLRMIQAEKLDFTAFTSIFLVFLLCGTKSLFWVFLFCVDGFTKPKSGDWDDR
ncbi:hypothetical protein SLEP1_g38655 [Rubroshorea leprosula]|uniref:Transmembrane protein n=1 Tax=Rubroshorea leprosula TaxID=152421 RepID=A0AAV5KYH3_9ROSI|nr:hypothetical protein SLEP1_g38655 [Rubroshorea leprosula]